MLGSNHHEPPAHQRTAPRRPSREHERTRASPLGSATPNPRAQEPQRRHQPRGETGVPGQPALADARKHSPGTARAQRQPTSGQAALEGVSDPGGARKQRPWTQPSPPGAAKPTRAKQGPERRSPWINATRPHSPRSAPRAGRSARGAREQPPGQATHTRPQQGPNPTPGTPTRANREHGAEPGSSQARENGGTRGQTTPHPRAQPH